MSELCTMITCQGPDPAAFLQGQLTVDVYRTEAPQLFACCNAKGRVIASGWSMPHQDDYILVVATSVAQLFVAHLQHFGRFNQITASQHPLDASTRDALPLPQGDANTQRQWLMDQGITWIEKESSGQFTPHMLNFPTLGAVHFDKGCYLGQEIIARTEHLGQGKRQTYQGTVDGTCPTLMMPIDSEEAAKVGTITMVASVSPKQHRILAVLPKTSTPLHCASGTITLT